MYSILLFMSLLFVTPVSDVYEKSWKFHHMKADQYFHEGNYPEMLYHLQQKVKYNHKDLESWSDLGYYYWSLSLDNKSKSEEFKNKAINYLKLGLEKNPDSTFLLDEIGRFYIYKSKDFNSAIPYFEKAIKNLDCNNITFHLLSLCYEKTNRVNESIRVLYECLKRYPNDAKAKNKMESFRD